MTAGTSTAQVRRGSLGQLGSAVERRLVPLQAAYLSGSPVARAQLAQLRRGVGKTAGEVPDIWELTVGLVPPQLSWQRDEPSRAEHAAHAAMTFYALHQQSQPTPAHVRGISFGNAASRLRDGDAASEKAVTRRFMTVATAESADEVLVHLRGLLTQFRSRGIGLDYAVMADDLMELLDPRRRIDVRLRWGRQFYRTTRSEDPTVAVTTAADDQSTEVPA